VFGQRSQLWWDVPVDDSFELLKDIYKVPEGIYRKNREELIELLDLSEIIRTPARQLSLGQRMRCEIAAALLHSPKILFLDEPTIGLDAVSKIAVRSFIRRMNRERGTTVILTTHDMQDIEYLTERILLIGKGQILLDGSINELKRRGSAVKTLTLEYRGQRLRERPGVTIHRDEDGHAEMAVDTAVISVSELIAGITAKADVQDFSVQSESMEEMVVSLYKEFEI